MKVIVTLIFLLSICHPSTAQENLLSPAQFLGYEPGEHFTPHHRMVEYFKHVADVAPNATLFNYGKTYENRPLIYLAITSAENIKDLESIRIDNLKRTGLLEGKPSGKKIAIVWLSYNVHGNEASSMEAAMLTLYELANPSNEHIKNWLNNIVVILDPCINPDGRDRYANFYNQYGNNPPNPRYDATEHHEPWPGGRTNHYFFDLNRDWAWCTQLESQQRIKVYNQWLPHVHVDFHEQGYNNPYFFAPAAEPLHDVISPWQRDFQLMIGKNNAKYFDEKGWLYFTKEVFDLYYPSYGDTYPTYNGAIGMTYEQAGGGAGGLSITTETGDPLTLRDRILHHHTSALSTIEITSVNASRVTDEFEKYFQDNNSNPASQYKTYVIAAENDPGKVARLTQWLDAHAIRYGHPSSAKSGRGYNFQTQTVNKVDIKTTDLVISAYQPKSRFITTIFEPTSRLSDSLTYDITAWNLMYAYNLEAYALSERIEPARPYQRQQPPESKISGSPYAYIFSYQNLEDVSFLAALMKDNINVRCAERAFTINGQTFPAGSLIVNRQNNQDISGFDQTVARLAAQYKRRLNVAHTGFVEQGKDLGSGQLHLLRAPEIAVLFGEQTSSHSSGEIWHFFEQQVNFPITQIGTDYFRNANIKKYDVLIIPEGNYTLFDDAMLEKISTWVRDGGRLILVGSALNSFADKKGFGLKKYANEAEKKQAEQVVMSRHEHGAFPRFEDVERRELSDNISGAIYKATLDNSHPLGFGMRASYYSLKNHERRFAWLSSGWNVGYFKGAVKPVQGFAGFRANAALKNSLIVGVEEIGAGHVVYFVDNPLFRNFWEEGKLLFSNAVFIVGR